MSPSMVLVDVIRRPGGALGDRKYPNGLPLRKHLVHPEFEDPPGAGGGVWAGPEHIVKEHQVGDPVVEMFLPEDLEYTPRGDPLLGDVAFGGWFYNEDEVGDVLEGFIVDGAPQLVRIQGCDFRDDELLVEAYSRTHNEPTPWGMHQTGRISSTVDVLCSAQLR
jgi:hypothetical protein